MPARRKETAAVLQRVINVRLNKQQSDKLEAYCKKNKVTKTMIVRQLIETLDI